MAFCKCGPEWWGATTGTQFKDQINLVVAEMGHHYGGRERGLKGSIAQDTEKLIMYPKKLNHRDAFTDSVQSLMKWIPCSMTTCSV